MVLGNCVIKFTNVKNPVFFSGDTVVGSISFHLETQKKVSDLTFQARGFTSCRWWKKSGGGRTRRRVRYSSENTHFKTVLFSLIIGHYPKDDGNFILEPRDHTFAFSFILPKDMPSSFEGEYGRVRYTIKVSALGFMKFFDNHTQIITVISKYDLNSNPTCMVPLTKEINRSFSFFFSSQGAMTLVLSLPVTGFVAGQDLTMQCNVTNSSKVEIPTIIFTLMQRSTFVSTHPRNSEKHSWKEILKHRGKGADKNEKTAYPVSFKIPALPPSSTVECYISIEYVIKVKVIVSGMHKNIYDMLPITIGTVPLHSSVQEHHNRSEEGVLPISPTAPPAIDQTPSTSDRAVGFDLPPSYDQIAPPTYEESQNAHMMKEQDSEDQEDHIAFSPFYPVYSFLPIGFKQ